MRLCALGLSIFSLALFTADQASGQTIIGYGINVGRAGVAGTAAGAAGAGATGIFRRLHGRLDAKPENGQSRTRGAEPVFDEDDLAARKKSEAEREQPAFENSGTIKTSSGVRISGLSSRRTSRRTYQPRAVNYQPLPPGPGSTPSPSASTSTVTASEKPTAPVPVEVERENSSLPAPAPKPVAAATPGKAVSEQAAEEHVGVRNARSSTAYAEPTDDLPAKQMDPELLKLMEIDSEIADIPAGTPIEDLIARFGKPLLKMAACSSPPSHFVG